MSIHPSLKLTAKGAVQRSVLTRLERIKNLMEKGLWQDGRSVIGLPKQKIVRVKFKKEKAAEKPAAEGEVSATETQATSPQAGATAPQEKATKAKVK
ncbi:MAG: small basic protein [Candidatus Omnitrophota bacterium]|nr:small basic protein [Candidatus Omnitrophota bacterium]